MASVGLLAGASLSLASPALALSSCTIGVTTAKSANVICTQDTGQVWAAIGCTKWWSSSCVWVRYGAWVGRSQVSSARCKWDEQPRITNGRVWHWYEGR